MIRRILLAAAALVVLAGTATAGASIARHFYEPQTGDVIVFNGVTCLDMTSPSGPTLMCTRGTNRRFALVGRTGVAFLRVPTGMTRAEVLANPTDIIYAGRW